MNYYKFKQYEYYVIIGVISLIALLFLPMIGSEAGLQWKIPNTSVGWIVYVTSKLIVALVNILIFHCFIQQAKINASKSTKYQEAITILTTSIKANRMSPRSPETYLSNVYSKKGVTIFATSILSSVGLTQAVLTFDVVSMLTYLVTIIFGVIFGILQMNDAEQYWTEEFYLYAKSIERELNDTDYTAEQPRSQRP